MNLAAFLFLSFFLVSFSSSVCHYVCSIQQFSDYPPIPDAHLVASFVLVYSALSIRLFAAKGSI